MPIGSPDALGVFLAELEGMLRQKDQNERTFAAVGTTGGVIDSGNRRRLSHNAPEAGKLDLSGARHVPDPERDENAFQEWFARTSKQLDLNPDPDAAVGAYDYRKAFRSGVIIPPSAKPGDFHFPSEFKRPHHPNRFVDGVDTLTGKPTDPRPETHEGPEPPRIEGARHQPPVTETAVTRRDATDLPPIPRQRFVSEQQDIDGLAATVKDVGLGIARSAEAIGGGLIEAVVDPLLPGQPIAEARRRARGSLGEAETTAGAIAEGITMMAGIFAPYIAADVAIGMVAAKASAKLGGAATALGRILGRTARPQTFMGRVARDVAGAGPVDFELARRNIEFSTANALRDLLKTQGGRELVTAMGIDVGWATRVMFEIANDPRKRGAFEVGVGMGMAAPILGFMQRSARRARVPELDDAEFSLMEDFTALARSLLDATPERLQQVLRDQRGAVGPLRPNEEIVAATVRMGDDVYEGATHGEALEQLIEKGDLAEEDIQALLGGDLRAFEETLERLGIKEEFKVSGSSGERLITREEAFASTGKSDTADEIIGETLGPRSDDPADLEFTDPRLEAATAGPRVAADQAGIGDKYPGFKALNEAERNLEEPPLPPHPQAARKTDVGPRRLEPEDYARPRPKDFPKSGDLKKLAIAGEKGRVWYKVFSKWIDENVLPEHRNDFMAMVSSTSPQANPFQNFDRARVLYAQFLEGRPLGERLFHTAKTLMESFQEATEALARGDEGFTTQFDLMGPKTWSFARNMDGDEYQVTADRIMSQIFYGVDQELKAVDYAQVTNAVREVAADLGWTPAETQAALWVAFRVNRDNWVDRRLTGFLKVAQDEDLDSFVQAADKVLADNNQPTFSDLMRSTREGLRRPPITSSVGLPPGRAQVAMGGLDVPDLSDANVPALAAYGRDRARAVNTSGLMEDLSTRHGVRAELDPATKPKGEGTPEASYAWGSWGGKIEPNAVLKIAAVMDDGTVTQPSTIDAIVSEVGAALGQDAIPWRRLKFLPPDEFKRLWNDPKALADTGMGSGIRIITKMFNTAEEMADFVQYMDREGIRLTGEGIGVGANRDELFFGNFEGLPPAEFESGVKQALEGYTQTADQAGGRVKVTSPFAPDPADRQRMSRTGERGVVQAQFAWERVLYDGNYIEAGEYGEKIASARRATRATEGAGSERPGIQRDRGPSGVGGAVARAQTAVRAVDEAYGAVNGLREVGPPRRSVSTAVKRALQSFDQGELPLGELGGIRPEVASLVARAGVGGALGAPAGALVAGEDDREIGSVLGFLAGAAGMAAPRIPAARRKAGLDQAGRDIRSLENEEFLGSVESLGAQARAATPFGRRKNIPGAGGVDPADVDPDEFLRNIERFSLDPEGNQILREEMRRVASEMGLAPKTVVPWSVTKAAAEEIGIDPKLLVRALGKQRATGAEQVAMMGVVKRNTERMMEILRQQEGRVTAEGAPLADDAIDRLQSELTARARINDNFLTRFIQTGTETGRDLNARKMMAARTMDPLDPLPWFAMARRQLGNRHAFTEEMQMRIVALLHEGDINKLIAYMQGIRPSTFFEKATAIRRANLLTSLTSHPKNLISNTGSLVLETLKDLPAAGVDAVLAKITGAGRTKASPFARGMARAAWEGAKKGVDESIAIMQGIPQEAAMRRFDIWRRTNFDNPAMDYWVNKVLLSYGAADAPHRLIGTYRSLQEQALLKARDEGFKGREAAERANFWRNNPTAEMRERAVLAGEYVTFQNKGTLAQGILGFKRAIREGGKVRVLGNTIEFPGSDLGGAFVDFLFPFTFTPANVATRTFEYSPAGVLLAATDTARIFEMLLKGHPVPAVLQRRAAERWGRTITGTPVAIYVGWKLHEAGLLSGSMPHPSSRDANQWREEGKIPNAFKFGERWYNLDGFSPVGNLMTLGANMRSQSLEGGPVAASFEAFQGAVRTVKQQSFLRSAEETLRLFDDFQMYGTPEALAKYTAFQTPSFVPIVGSTIVRQAASATDPVLRARSKNPLDELKKRFGFGGDLPAEITSLGEERERDRGVARSIIEPFYSRKDQTKMQPILAEMNRVGAAFPRRQRGKEETPAAFHARMVLEGRAVRQDLLTLFQSQQYWDLDQEHQQEAIQDVITDARRRERDNINDMIESRR
jgi:hypothetical protein